MSQISVEHGPRSTPMTNQEYDQMMLNYFGGTPRAAAGNLIGPWIMAALFMAITVTPLVCGILYMLNISWFIENTKTAAVGVWLISSIIMIIIHQNSCGEAQLNADVVRRHYG